MNSPNHDHQDPARDQRDTPANHHITPNQTTSPTNPRSAAADNVNVYDQRWPGSKFVLTIREEDDWLHSCRKHWAGLSNFKYDESEEYRVFMDIRKFLEAAVYGCHEFNEERFRRVYRRHVQNVTSYFAGRESDLLVLNIVAGDGYERLAHFLGVPAPKQPFPHDRAPSYLMFDRFGRFGDQVNVSADGV